MSVVFIYFLFCFLFVLFFSGERVSHSFLQTGFAVMPHITSWGTDKLCASLIVLAVVRYTMKLKKGHEDENTTIPSCCFPL